jgi:hypothetical protein
LAIYLSRNTGDPNLKQQPIPFGGHHNSGFGSVDNDTDFAEGQNAMSSAPAALVSNNARHPHHTYHGQTARYRPALGNNLALQITNPQTDLPLDQSELHHYPNPTDSFNSNSTQNHILPSASNTPNISNISSNHREKYSTPDSEVTKACLLK